jgi:hypothetical protein
MVFLTFQILKLLHIFKSTASFQMITTAISKVNDREKLFTYKTGLNRACFAAKAAILILGTPFYVNAVIAQSVRAGRSGFDSRRVLGIFLFTTASRTALGPTQPPIQCVPGALSLGVKRPGREADHSPPSSAEVKE